VRVPRLLSDDEVNMLRGKALVGAMTRDDQLALCEHLTLLEMALDREEEKWSFGNKGWRQSVGIPGAE
jgi:hypothetical protein